MIDITIFLWILPPACSTICALHTDIRVTPCGGRRDVLTKETHHHEDHDACCDCRARHRDRDAGAGADRDPAAADQSVAARSKQWSGGSDTFDQSQLRRLSERPVCRLRSGSQHPAAAAPRVRGHRVVTRAASARRKTKGPGAAGAFLILAWSAEPAADQKRTLRPARKMLA